MRNGDNAGDLTIENKVQVVIRGKDLMSAEEADSPCRRIYFIIQLMYVDEINLQEYHNIYWSLVRDVLKAAPSTHAIIDEISTDILCGRYYRALKTARRLIKHEQQLLRGVLSNQ